MIFSDFFRTSISPSAPPTGPPPAPTGRPRGRRTFFELFSNFFRTFSELFLNFDPPRAHPTGAARRQRGPQEPREPGPGGQGPRGSHPGHGTTAGPRPRPAPRPRATGPQTATCDDLRGPREGRVLFEWVSRVGAERSLVQFDFPAPSHHVADSVQDQCHRTIVCASWARGVYVLIIRRHGHATQHNTRHYC